MNHLKSVTFLILFYLGLFPTLLDAQNNAILLFENDAYQLSNSASAQLEQLYQSNLKTANTITLIGHTDNNGSDDYNLLLSKKRVNEVKLELLKMGIDSSVVKIEYRGEKSPLNGNNTELEKSANRRVDISWTSETTEKGSIKDLYTLLEREKQSFCINPNRDTTLYLEQGTIITIPAGTFASNGNKCITFNTKEIYTFSDMILENLSTQSNGRMLETAGMVYTEAFDANGNAVKIELGKAITVMIPTDTLRDDMRLFNGDRIGNNDEMNWTLIGGQETLIHGDGLPTISDCYEYKGGRRIEAPCLDCPFYFCGIKSGINGLTDEDVKAQNKANKDCRKNKKKGIAQYAIDSTGMFSQCDQWMLKYGVSTLEELDDTLNKLRAILYKNELDKYGVKTYPEYLDTLQKIREAKLHEEYAKYGVTNQSDYLDTLRKLEILNLENRLENGQGNAQDLKYYSANISQLGWINCDAFSSVPSNQKINAVTNLKVENSTDCSLIFTSRRSIMKASFPTTYFSFNSIPKNQEVWLLALKYVDGQAYISLLKTETKIQMDPIEFRPVSIEELKKVLLQLNN